MTLSDAGESLYIHRHTLSNGLRVWIQPRLESESVLALLTLRAGARYEHRQNNGISHFVEHMVFTGTERWNEEELKQIITRRGGEWNGQTDLESTDYYVQVAAPDFEIGLDWLLELVFRAVFPADKVNKERQVIFEEKFGRYGWLINTLDEHGFGYNLERDIRQVLFPGSSLAAEVIGKDDSLDRIDRTALLAYYRRYYVPANAVLVVVGKVKPEQVLEVVERCAGSLAPGEASPRFETPALPPAGPQRVIVRGPWPTDQERLMLGARTVGQGHADRWALEVLAELLEQELMEEVRYKRGWVYIVMADNTWFEDAGYLSVYALSDANKRPLIQAEIETRLEQIRAGQIEAKRLAEAKSALKGQWTLALEDNERRAYWLSEWAVLDVAGGAVPDYGERIEAVEAADLVRVAQTYLIPQRSYVGLHQPILTASKAMRAMAGAASVLAGAWAGRKLWGKFKWAH